MTIRKKGSERTKKKKPYVLCPECGDKLDYVLIIHAEKHGYTLAEFIAKYPKLKSNVYKK